MSYSGESTVDAQDRLQREREAAAFLSSLGPQFEKAPHGGGSLASKKVIAPHTAGRTANAKPAGVVVNGAVAGQRHVALSSSSPSSRVVSVTVSPEAEEKRQQALRRLKATHCSVNHDKVHCKYGIRTDIHNSTVSYQPDVHV